MDPKKQANQLDPKLKEVYDRVMGTTVAPSATPIQQPNASVATPPPTSPSQSAPVTPQRTQTTVVQNIPSTITQASGAPTHSVVSAGSLGKKHVDSSTEGKKGGAGPVIFIILGVVMLLVYTFVWLKIFNVSLPFLP